MDWTQIVIALVSTGGIGTTVAAVRKTWKAQGDAGYQRRVKEEQAEEALETITELESEVSMLMTETQEAQKRGLEAEAFITQQQQIIADQARALATLDPGKGVGD